MVLGVGSLSLSLSVSLLPLQVNFMPKTYQVFEESRHAISGSFCAHRVA